MATQWMAYSPEDGWLAVTEEYGQKLRAMIRADDAGELEGCKVACVPEPFTISGMKRPAMMISNDLSPDDICAILKASGATFPPMAVHRSDLLPTGTIVVMETAVPDLSARAFYPTSQP